MKNYISAGVISCLLMFCLAACDKKSPSNGSCNEATLNQLFTAKINEQWCLDGTNWKIRFGPMVEDSRCNVTGIQCVWAGQYVMAVTINNGEPVQDTFYAVNNWTDTLYQGGYQIILAKVYPEIRTTTDPLDPSAYSFDVLIK